jgi:DNA polymerase-3 subunit alpha
VVAAPVDSFEVRPEFSEKEIFAMEKEIIGFLISNNPLARFETILQKKVTKKIGEIGPEDNNATHIIAGVISGKKLIKTKKDNHEMAFLHCFDDTGSIEVVVFPKTYASLKSILDMNKILLMKGKVNERDGGMSFLLEKAVDLERIETN